MTDTLPLLFSFALGMLLMGLIVIFTKRQEKIIWKDCEVINGQWNGKLFSLSVTQVIQRNQKGEYRLISKGEESKHHSSYGQAYQRLCEIQQVDQYKHLFKEV